MANKTPLINKSSSQTYTLHQLNETANEKCRRYAKKEFSQLAKDHQLDYHSRKINLRTPADEKFIGGNSVFGVRLGELLALDEMNGALSTHMPVFAQMLFDCLEWHGYKHVGILGTSPDMRTANAIKGMCAKDFYGQRVNIEERLLREPVHVTAHLLMLFIRLLPDTLFTKELADAFAHLADIDDLEDRLAAMKMLVFQLPPVNAIVLNQLLHALQMIAENRKYNQMSVDAIARIMAMSLFIVDDDVRVSTKKSLVHKPPFNVMAMLIECREYLFTVPQVFVARLREDRLDDTIKIRTKKGKFTTRRKRRY